MYTNATRKNYPRAVNSPIDDHKKAIQENRVLMPMWRSRGYLPHFESSDVTQHVTFHLDDSLPQSALLRWEAELKALPIEKRDAERRKRVDAWIDGRPRLVHSAQPCHRRHGASITGAL